MKDAYLKFCYGAMGCGKTMKLHGDYYGKTEDGFEVIVIKPLLDTKGEASTLARDGRSIGTTFLIEENDDIYIKIAKYLLDHNLDFILVDEAQFLKKHQVDALAQVADVLGVNVICYGLKTDFKGYLFEGSKRLFEIADPLEPITRQCSCGNNKTFNMRLENGVPVFEGEIVAIDGVDATYESVCRKCYKNARKKVLQKKKN